MKARQPFKITSTLARYIYAVIAVTLIVSWRLLSPFDSLKKTQDLVTHVRVPMEISAIDLVRMLVACENPSKGQIEVHFQNGPRLLQAKDMLGDNNQWYMSLVRNYDFDWNDEVGWIRSPKGSLLIIKYSDSEWVMGNSRLDVYAVCQAIRRFRTLEGNFAIACYLKPMVSAKKFIPVWKQTEDLGIPFVFFCE